MTHDKFHELDEMAAEALHETNSPIKLYQVQPNLMTQKLDIRELR